MSAPYRLLHEPEVFSTFFNQTHLIIFRYIYGLCGGPVEEVEDLTSETYIRAWKARNNFSGDDHDALRWLFTIARNLVIDAFRKKNNRYANNTQDLDEAVLDNAFQSGHPSPEKQAIRHEQLKHLWKVIQDLPLERREMLILRYMIGWQVKQIADYLNMNENTISVYIRRSINQIHDDWNDQGEPI